jgi:pimeloyl-ACP methyl ester carboxylesterase
VERVVVDREPGGVEVALHCRVLGADAVGADRPTYVLVHGLASNCRLWDGVAEHLGAQGFSSVAIDLRSHGLSSKTDVGNDTVTAAHDVSSVIAQLQLGRVVVVGQSWGGNVAVELAAQHGRATLSHAVDLASICCVDGGFIELAGRFGDTESALTALTPPPLVGTPESVMRQRVASFTQGWPDSGVEGTMANFEVRSDGTIAPWLTLNRHLDIVRSLLSHHPSQLWPSIAVPVLFCVPDGGSDDWSSARHREVAHAIEAIDDASVVWFADGVHDIHAQQPVAVANALIALGEKDI